MACSTNFPTPQNNAGAGSGGDSSRKSREDATQATRPKEPNVQQAQPALAPRALVNPLVPTARRRMSEQASSAGAGAVASQPAQPSSTIAVLLIVFDSQTSPGRSTPNGVLHLRTSLPAQSLPLYPPAVSLIPRAFLARAGERPHQLEQFSTPRYANYVVSTARVPSLQRSSEVLWTPLGPLAGLIDGTAYTTAVVPTLDLDDQMTKTFLEELARNIPGGRLPFDPRRVHVLYLAPIERRYHASPTQQQPKEVISNVGSPTALPSARQLFSSHQSYPSQAPYAGQYTPGSASFPTPTGSRPSSSSQVKQEAAESSQFARRPGVAYDPRTPTSPNESRPYFPSRENLYILSRADSPDDDSSPNRSSDTTSPSAQSNSLSPAAAYRPLKRGSSRVSPAGSATALPRAYSQRLLADDIAFPHIASYLASRFPDIAIALERNRDPVPSLTGPWWFHIHTSAFMHVCNTLDMSNMRDTQVHIVPAQYLPGPPGPQAPWDGRITADDVARWFGSFPKSNTVARSTIRNHVGVLRRWQTLWERTEMQYYRDRGILARPLPPEGPERDAYYATELLGVLGFVFARNTEERRELLVKGMHPQQLERCANRWPWGEVEDKIVKFYPEFGPRRRPRESRSGGED